MCSFYVRTIGWRRCGEVERELPYEAGGGIVERQLEYRMPDGNEGLGNLPEQVGI